MVAVAAYIVGIVLVNVGFAHVPLVPIGETGEMWPPLSLAVGVILILRDFAQRAIGHYVWAAMIAGCALSYWMAAPAIALASAVAFLVAETVDWVVYSYTRRSLADRILISSIVAGPIDSAVFLVGAGLFGWTGWGVMSASKLLAAAALWAWWRSR